MSMIIQGEYLSELLNKIGGLRLGVISHLYRRYGLVYIWYDFDDVHLSAKGSFYRTIIT